MAYLNLTFSVCLICIAWGEVSVTKTIILFSFLLLSLIKSSELFRPFRCVGCILLTLVMSNRSAALSSMCFLWISNAWYQISTGYLKKILSGLVKFCNMRLCLKKILSVLVKYYNMRLCSNLE